MSVKTEMQFFYLDFTKTFDVVFTWTINNSTNGSHVHFLV